MATLSLQLDIEVDGDADEMATTIAQYLTQEDHGLFDDYGYGAWGGYEGPFVVSCAVRRNGRVIGQHANRVKPEED